MEVLINQYKHCDVIRLTGRLDSESAPQFADAIETSMNNGRFKLVIDMSKLTFLSSAGLRVLINGQKTAKRYNRGEIVLAHVPEKIMSSLDLAGFKPLFKIYDDIVPAVANF